MTTNKIITCHNILNPLDRTVRTSGNYKNIDEILKDLKYDNEIYDLVISKNSVIQDGFFEVESGDVVNISIVPKGGGGGGGKGILKAVMMVVVAIASIYTGFAATAAYGTMYGAMAAVGVSVAGSLLVNALMPTPKPSFDFNKQDFRNSQAYGWNKATNQTMQSQVIPKIFGIHKITPPLIASYIEAVDDKQYFNGLYAINDGAIRSVADIKINNENIANFKGVSYEIRNGETTQAIVERFGDTPYDKVIGKKLSPDLTYSLANTDGNAVTSLAVTLLMPRGLWYANDNGGLANYGINVRIEFSKDQKIWLPMTSQKIMVTDPNSNRYDWHYDELTGDYVFDKIDEKIEKTVPYVTISGAQTSVIRKTFEVVDLPPARYYIRAKFETAPEVSNRYASDCYIEYVTETTKDDFIYPGTALLAVRALATDQLNGSAPTVTCVVSANSSNPAEVAEQILIDSGVETSRIMPSFKEWAKFCNEKKLTCNIVFDSEVSVKKALDTVGLLGRASVLQAGSKFDVIIEKTEILPVQSFLFGMGNILSGTFKQSFLPLVDRANFVEITYYDKNKEYEPSIISVGSRTLDNSRMTSKTSVTLIGCTDEEQAKSYGRFLLNCNRYLTETIEFEADKDSLVCRYGDVIRVSHDVPQYGFSGRLEADSAGDILTLDRSIEDFSHKGGAIYAIQIKNDVNEVMEYQILEFISPDKVKVDLNGADYKKYDNYALGEINKVSKLYRIIKVSTGGEFTRHITAIEYNEDIYNDKENISATDYSLLGVRNLRMNEYLKYDAAKNIKTMLALAWSGNSLFYLVTYKSASEERTIKVFNSAFEFEAKEGETYEITVKDGAGYGAGKIYSVLGKLYPPEPVENLKASELRDVWVLSWDYLPPLDFKEFEIYEDNVLVGKTALNKFDMPKTKLNSKLSVRAVDTSGVRSKAASLDLSVAPLADIEGFSSIYEDNKNLAFWRDMGENYEIRKGFKFETAYSVYTGSATSAFLSSIGTYLIKAFYVNAYGLRVESKNAAVLIIDETLAPQNVIERINSPAWSGHLDNAQLFGNSLALATDIPLFYHFDLLPNVDLDENIDEDYSGGRKVLSKTGYYESDKIINLTDAKLCEISSSFDAVGLNLNSNFDLLDNVDLAQNIDGLNSGAFDVAVEISLSVDGVSFGEFRDFKDGRYVGKAFKFRLKLTTRDELATPLIRSWSVIVDMPDVIESGSAFSDESGDTFINYKNNFSVSPKVQITIINALVGDDAILTNQSKEGFMIKIIDKTGASVRREFNYIAKGY